MYEFSSKSQLQFLPSVRDSRCLRYCKCTSFQANHNLSRQLICQIWAVCDTANVRVFKQITTCWCSTDYFTCCLRYCKCTSFQANHNMCEQIQHMIIAVCDTANVRVFKQITTSSKAPILHVSLFAILQMYEFSSKSQLYASPFFVWAGCLRYCKCTSFQANHNPYAVAFYRHVLFAILQMYEFSSKSQQYTVAEVPPHCCLRYCECTSFQANHNNSGRTTFGQLAVCDTA